MKSIRKSIYCFILVLTFILGVCFSCGAAQSKKTAYNNLHKISTDILSVSFRGDTSAYPENSLEGVISAFKKGADMVSVNVMKTADGVFILCENESLNNICDSSFESVSVADYESLSKSRLYDNGGNITKCTFATLEKLIKKTNKNLFLILDFDWQERDEIYNIIQENRALDRVFLRTKQSASDICEFVNSKTEKPYVIGVYDGGIIFNAISHINKLSELGMPLVQYSSKNYFNVMYESLVNRNYSAPGKASAIAPCYDPDLCGQRTDSQSGWDTLINRGFTVIETSDICSFVEYLKQRESAMERLEVLKVKADGINKSKYASVSLENLNSALENAEAVLQGRKASLDKIQCAFSTLTLAMNKLMIKTGDDTQRGALNITTGKIIAAVLVTVGILSWETFIHKMHTKAKKKKK